MAFLRMSRVTGLSPGRGLATKYFVVNFEDLKRLMAQRGKTTQYRKICRRLFVNGKSCFCAPVLCFARSYKDGGQSDTYLKTKGHAAKKELQKQWCELQLARHVAKKEKSTGYQKVDKSKGKYKSLRDLARKEGLQKALAYAQKCSALGGSWLQWDDMWDHWVFLKWKSRGPRFSRRPGRFIWSKQVTRQRVPPPPQRQRSPPPPQRQPGTASGVLKMIFKKRNHRKSRRKT